MSNKKDKSDIQQRLWAYLDGELSESDSAQLERQLAADPQLQAELRNCAEVNKQLGDIGEDDLQGIDPAAQREQIMGVLERQALLGPSRRRFSLRPVVSILSAAAVVAIIATAGWLIFQPSTPKQQSQVVITSLVHPFQPSGLAKVAVQYPRLDWTQQPPQARSNSMPRGTIVVSIGVQTDDVLSDVVPMPMGI